MMRSYDKFDEAERRVIRQWQIGIAAFYTAVFLVVLSLVIVDQAADNGGASAMQAKMTSSQTGSAADLAEIAHNRDFK